jgi:hypothetical protein
MAEPASSSGVGVAIAAGTITFTGSILGVQYDALLAGFFGGLLSLSYLPPMTRWRIAGSVATSALLAGFFAPVLAVAAMNYLPWMASLGDFTRLTAAAAVGLFAQPLIPLALAFINKLGGKGSAS